MTESPRDLQIRVQGTTAFAYPEGNGLEQEAPFYGALYMKEGRLWVKGNYDCSTGACYWTKGTFYGSIIGDVVYVAAHNSSPQSPVDFHYDEALRDLLLGSAGSTGFQILSWQELAPNEM